MITTIIILLCLIIAALVSGAVIVLKTRDDLNAQWTKIAVIETRISRLEKKNGSSTTPPR